MMKYEFILGGYFIVKAAQRAECMDKELLPQKIITISECICDILPSTWALSWVNKSKQDIESAKSIWGLSDNEFDELENWVTGRFDEGKFGWQYGFGDLIIARECCRRYLKDTDDIYILGIGLSKKDASVFLDREKPCKGIGSTLAYDVLQRNELIDTTGFLGFDVLGYDIGSFHSYICNGLEDDFFEIFGIRPNQYGLYESYEGSKQAAEYLLDEKIGAEPALWQSWAVCKFQISE
ncbi:MAG: hypothetical protein AAGU75_11770 [Bacillota bacterium]